MQLFNKKKISIIVEMAFSSKVIHLLEELGVGGYTIYPEISGKGKHGARNGHTEFASGILGNVEIVTIVSEKTAEPILKELADIIESGVVIIVHVIDVQVLRKDYFA